MTEPCPFCDGSGWSCPSPFHEDSEPPEPWRRALEGAERAILEGPYPPESFPAFTGLLRAVPCRRGCPAARPPDALAEVACPRCGNRVVYPTDGRPARLVDFGGCGGSFVAAGSPHAGPGPVIPAPPFDLPGRVPVPPLPPDPGPGFPPAAPHDTLREGWFVSRYTGYACFQDRVGARRGMLRSTVKAVEVAAADLVDPSWCRGTLFECRPPAPAPAPAPVVTATNAAVRVAVTWQREAEAQAARHPRGGPQRSKRELAERTLFGGGDAP